MTEHSKVVALLLLIHCSLLPPLCVCLWGGGGMVGSCFVVHYLVYSFAIISLGMRERESWLLYFNCILLSSDSYQYSVSLPRGAVVWST